MDFVVVRINGRNLKAKSLEQTLEEIPRSNDSIVVELRRREPSTHFRNVEAGNFQTFSSSDDQAATSTMTSDYICIDKGHDFDEENDDDDDDDDDDYDDLELWCGSKEISSNFITHMTNCRVCSEASNIHLSLLESLQQLEESESEDEDNNNNNNNINLDYDEVLDDVKSFESDSALDDSMVNETYMRQDNHYHHFLSNHEVSRRNLKNVRHNSTDTTISSNHDDSAIGRTESIRADESSEQELVDSYGAYPFCLSKSYHFESSKLSSSDLSSGNNSINNTNFINEVAEKCASTDLLSDLPSIRALRRSRKVPKMGTRITKQVSNELHLSPQDQNFEENQIWLRQSNLNLTSNLKEIEPANMKFRSISSSKSSLSDHSKESVESMIEKNSDKEPSLHLDQSTTTVYTSLKLSNSIHFPKRCLRSGSSSKSGKNVSFNISGNQILQTSDNIDEDNYMHLTNVVNGNTVESSTQNLKGSQISLGEKNIPKHSNEATKEENVDLLRRLYSQHIDVMYTNQANLEHTMMVQQKLFTQQLHLLHQNRKDKCLHQPNSKKDSHEISCDLEEVESTNQNAGPEMHWVMKKRSDGSRYITRRPVVKKEKLRKRCDKFSEERKEMTTDDDAASEMKTGKYWTREERREQVREKKNRVKMKTMMDTVCENEVTPQDRHQQYRGSDKKNRSGHKKGRSKEGGHRIEVPLPFIKGHLQSLLVKGGSNQLLSVTTV